MRKTYSVWSFIIPLFICSMPFGCTHSSCLVVWIGYPSTDRLKFSRRACRFSLSGEFSMLICHASSTLSMERKPKWHTTYTNIPDFIVVFVVCWYSQGFKQPPTNTDCNDMNILTRLFMETLLLMLHLQSCFKVFGDQPNYFRVEPLLRMLILFYIVEVNMLPEL